MNASTKKPGATATNPRGLASAKVSTTTATITSGFAAIGVHLCRTHMETKQFWPPGEFMRTTTLQQFEKFLHIL